MELPHSRHVQVPPKLPRESLICETPAGHLKMVSIPCLAISPHVFVDEDNCFAVHMRILSMTMGSIWSCFSTVPATTPLNASR